MVSSPPPLKELSQLKLDFETNAAFLSIEQKSRLIPATTIAPQKQAFLFMWVCDFSNCRIYIYIYMDSLMPPSFSPFSWLLQGRVLLGLEFYWVYLPFLELLQGRVLLGLEFYRVYFPFLQVLMFPCLLVGCLFWALCLPRLWSLPLVPFSLPFLDAFFLCSLAGFHDLRRNGKREKERERERKKERICECNKKQASFRPSFVGALT